MKSRKSDHASKRSAKKRTQQHKSLRSKLRAFETLEERRLLTVAPWTDGLYYPPIGKATAFLPPDLSYAEYAAISDLQYGGSGNGGSLSGEGTQGFTTVNEVESNNRFVDANPINLGTGANNNDGVAIVGRLERTNAGFGDEDYFTFNLRAGDILDAVVQSGTNNGFEVSIFNSARQEIIGNNAPIGGGYPVDSPLSTGGNAGLAVVIPEDGTYFARITSNNATGPAAATTYTMTLRTFRPVLESEPVGTVQTVFLDFDGAITRREAFGAFGTARLSPLSSFLAGWGLQPQDEDRIIDKIVAEFTSKFYGATAITGVGGNGNYIESRDAGEFGLVVLNSRDHADPFGNPNVSRIIIGGTQAELLIPTIGIAQSIDVGNFDTAESAVTLLDLINPLWGAIPRAGNVPLEDILVDAIASVTAHEAGHFFGGWHTLNSNASDQIMDTGGNLAGLVGVGPDGIYGTPDDVDVQFGTDTYDPFASAIPFGQQNSSATIAWGLATGTTGGGTITGNVFHDRNVNRTLDSADIPLTSVEIYVDMDNDGVHDPVEPRTVSDAAGNYSFDLLPGTYTIRETVPAGYKLTTPVSESFVVAVAAGQTVAGRNFGNELLDQNITGLKFNDVNGNGLRDSGEEGIEGVFIYIDLDHDNRIDIGEPATQTAANGTYRLSFPGPGTYAVREVIPSGFVQTFPGISNDADPLNDFEHTVVVTGNPTLDASTIAGLNFGNRLTVDFGDAPSSYGVASHGFVPGLTLGTNWDAEQSSQFSGGANGDDLNGINDSDGNLVDDEDGIVLSRPLVAGSTNNRITVTAENSTGANAYLSGWIDFNKNGTFESTERVIANEIVGTGSTNVTFTAPQDAQLGDTIARFRYSSQLDVGATGSSSSGEVEDYVLNITDELNIAVSDQFTVSRNSIQNRLDVLANDFRLPGETLVINSISASQAGGTLQVTGDNQVLYTPPNGFIGQDSFTYTMQNSGGDTDTASVTIDVNLFFENPLAVDDSFDTATNIIDFPLNVLANDIEGQDGALTIVSVTQPDKGGSISIATGGNSLRYTPPRDFGGTEFFTYTVGDGAGNRSSAQVTVHTLPGDRADDDVEIRFVTTDLNGTPISAIQQGQQFKVQMFVDDLRFNAGNPGTAAGVYAAYTDLLYNLQLVSTVANNDANSQFNFEVSFFNDYLNFRTGDATIPGIINEFGAFSTRPVMDEPDPLLLAEVTFSARSPGIASFKPDPADNFPLSDSLLFDTPGSAVPVEKIRYIGASIEIVGDGVEFPVAIDDSVPAALPAGTIRFPVDVLSNDLRGSTGVITIVSSTPGLNGATAIDTRGTSNPADDRILYTPNAGFNGADQFTYTIQDARGIQSTATVTLRVGDATSDDIVDLPLVVTDLNGQPIEEITVGSQFQVRGYVQDLRGFGLDRGIFAAYEDVLYSSQLVSPVASTTNDPNLGFQVQFGPNYQRVREGDIRLPGVINELGAVQIENGNNSLGSNQQLLFIVTMTANSVGTANFVGDPADISPLHDTLTFEPPAPVSYDQIRFGFDTLNIVSAGGGGGGEGFHNYNNAYDVNADGWVSPLDVLLVIGQLNDLAANGEGEHSDEGIYPDVDNNGHITPLDALMVINEINNRLGGNGEGEGSYSALLSSGSLAESSEGVVSDSIAADMPTATPLAQERAGTIEARLTGATYGPTRDDLADSIFGDDSEEGLDGLLEQLAPEIEETWKQTRV